MCLESVCKLTICVSSTIRHLLYHSKLILTLHYITSKCNIRTTKPKQYSPIYWQPLSSLLRWLFWVMVSVYIVVPCVTTRNWVSNHCHNMLCRNTTGDKRPVRNRPIWNSEFYQMLVHAICSSSQSYSRFYLYFWTFKFHLPIIMDGKIKYILQILPFHHKVWRLLKYLIIGPNVFTLDLKSSVLPDHIITTLVFVFHNCSYRFFFRVKSTCLWRSK